MAEPNNTQETQPLIPQTALPEQEENPINPSKCCRRKRMSILTSVGILLFVVPIWTVVLSSDLMLFSFHPLFASLAVALFASGISTMQVTSANVEERKRRLVYHQIFQMHGVFAIIIAEITIIYNKYKQGHLHMTSIHAQLGATTFLSILGVASFGYAVVHIPALFGGEAKARSFYRFHRLGGYFTLLLLVITATFGTRTDWFQLNSDGKYNTVLLIAASFIVIGSAIRITFSKLV